MEHLQSYASLKIRCWPFLIEFDCTNLYTQPYRLLKSLDGCLHEKIFSSVKRLMICVIMKTLTCGRFISFIRAMYSTLRHIIMI